METVKVNFSEKERETSNSILVSRSRDGTLRTRKDKEQHDRIAELNHFLFFFSDRVLICCLGWNAVV